MKTPAPWKAKPHRADYDEMRMRIIEAAWELASEHGFKAISLNQVAQEAGCARSSVYRYFDSKDQLMTAVLSEGIYAVGEEINEQLAGIDDPRELVVRGCYYAISAVRTNPAMRLLWFGEQTDGLHLAELTLDAAPQFISHILRLNPAFERARQEGLVRPDLTIEDITQWLVTVTLSLSLSTTFGSDQEKELTFLRKMLLPSIFVS